MSDFTMKLGNFEAVPEISGSDNFATGIYENDYDGLLIARCNQNGRYPEHARAILEGLNGKKHGLDQITTITAERDSLKALCDDMAKALEPFAECCQYIEDSEDDEEWAKFRLIVRDYRRAKAVVAKAKEADHG